MAGSVPAITHERCESKIVIHFEDGDPENPYNWSRGKKLWIVFIGTLATLNSTIASSLPSGDAEALQRHFGVNVQAQLVLPNSTFLIGYVLGPFVFAPLSEHLGRRWIIMSTFTCFTLFMMATALAPNWPAFLVFRLFTGLFASTPISNTGGLFADIYGDPVYRGRALAWFLAVASAGPALGPLPSGYLSTFGWRWTFWFGLILAGSCLIPFLFLPETFAPAILKIKAQQLRKDQPGRNIYASSELQPKLSARQFASKVLGRPLRMMTTEPIVTACCLYVSLIYAVIFMFFQAYPIIYKPIYGFTEGQTGLAWLPVAIGSLLALPVCFYWDYLLRTAKAKDRPWSTKVEYQRLPLALFGGPLFTIGMFWIGWAAKPDVHWIVPILGGFSLGIGFVLIFVALFNYLVDAYKTYSASALGATSISRSTFGVVLPLAARPMYQTLGVAWASSLLGFLSLLMCFIPLLFLRYGERLRLSSPICQELAHETEKAAASGPEPDVEKRT